METACLLGALSSIDSVEVRRNIVRIPEVGIKIREVQKALDGFSEKPIDIFSCLELDDATFQKLGVIREIALIAIQLGLYSRYTKKFGRPNMLVASRGSLLVLKVFLGLITIDELLRPLALGQNSLFMESPSHIGQSKSNFEVMKWSSTQESEGFHAVDISAIAPADLVHWLVEEMNIGRIVNIGPGEGVITTHNIDPMYERLQICESIEMDPMLNWFWPNCLVSKTVA